MELKENDKLIGNRIGLFGGTFNPIHVGHLQAAGNVQKSFALDKICLIPSALPPHKATEDVVDAEDRMEMIRLAIPPLANFLVSDVELNRSGPSYTIDTVIHFKSGIHPETRLFLIMGIDAFLEITTWKSYRKLLRLIPVIAMARPGIGNHSGMSGWKIFEEYLISSISPDYVFSVPQGCYFHPENQPIFIFNGDSRDVSSTKIRNLIKTGGSIKDMVPETVAEYIKAEGLYQ